MKHRALLALIVLACSALGFRQADQTTPEATVKAFAAALQGSDFKAAARVVKGGKSDFDYSVLARDFKKEALKIEVLELKADVQGDKATATFKILFTPGNAAPQTMGPETLRLERANGTWLIVPAATVTGKAPLGEFAKLLTDPGAAMVQAHDAAESTVCLSNMKQLCTAMMMLSTDYDDVFKVKPDSWKKSVWPYAKNEGIFHCPMDKSGAVSYSVNPHVAGRASSAIAMPAETVLLYEGHNMKLDFRHNGRACVGFVDGHVKLVTQTQAKYLRWKP